MPRFPVLTTDSAPEKSRETLSSLARRRGGNPLNIHAGMANSPAVLNMYAGMSAAIAANGTFDARTREAIALAVGAENGCGYCQSIHTMTGTAAGLTDEQAVAIRRGSPEVDPRLAALLTVARGIAANLGEVDEDTYQAALAAGWTTDQLAELYAHVAANQFTNYFNHYNGTDLDIPAAPGVLTG